MIFRDRHRELEALRARLARPSSFTLVYGQRRVGKTFLLRHLLNAPRDAIGLYFLADESTGGALLHRFHQEVQATGAAPALWPEHPPADWGTALTLLLQGLLGEGRRIVLVLDEFQYLLAAEPALPSILQRLWDVLHPRGGLHLILCGSALGTMARLGDQGQPLHGRFDLKLPLRPFPFADAARFVPGWSPIDAVRAYAVFGGLARHLAELRPEASLAENAVRTVLDPLAPLHEAPLDLLRTEHLGSHANASAVLAAVASGENRFNAIAARTGLTSDRVALVFEELIALEILRRERRFGDRPGSRYTRYRCADPFTTFWFRFVHPNRSALATAEPRRIWDERVAPRLPNHLGEVFEDVVRQAVLRGDAGPLGVPVDEVAPWWSRDGQTELNLVVRSGERVFAIECKWRAGGVVDLRDLQRLREHVARTPGFRPTDLAMATAGAFGPRLRAAAKAEGVVLLSLEDLLARTGDVKARG